MPKMLIDIDDALLERARAMLGANTTKKDAVNTALSKLVRLHDQRETIDWIVATDPVGDLRDPEVRAAARRSVATWSTTASSSVCPGVPASRLPSAPFSTLSTSFVAQLSPWTSSASARDRRPTTPRARADCVPRSSISRHLPKPIRSSWISGALYGEPARVAPQG